MPLGNYLGLVLEAVLLLVAFVLAFGALTVVWRRHWLSFGPTESLLGRLAAGVLLAMLALGGTQYLVGLVLTALQPNQFGGFAPAPPPGEGRNQALGVILVALALTVIGVLRIELYHRRATGISHRDESEDEWRTEEPKETRAPR